MYAEFLGLPGAGKSVVSRAIGELLRGQNVVVTEPTYHMDHVLRFPWRQVLKSWYALRGALRRPQDSWFWVRMIMRSRQPTLARMAAEILYWFYVLELARRQSERRGVHLFDQGLHQALWSIAYEGRQADITSPQLLDRLERCFPRQAVVVIVEAGISIVGPRLEARPGFASRVERDLTTGKSVTSFARAALALQRAEAAAAQLAQHRRITLLRVNNDGDASPPAGAARVAELLRQLSASSDRTRSTNPAASASA